MGISVLLMMFMLGVAVDESRQKDGGLMTLQFMAGLVISITVGVLIAYVILIVASKGSDRL